MFSIANVSAQYRHHSHHNNAIASLSLSLHGNSLHALIGPNGSGKTTLLRVLAKLMDYSGCILLNGQELSTFSRKAFAQNVSFTMSAQSFHPAYPFTAREILQLHLQLQNVPVNLDSILHYTDALGVTKLLSRNILSLSDGQRQLTLIAAALTQNTPIMLLDEPTSTLDPDKSALVFSLLRRLADNGKCIITSSHDINAVIPYATDFIALKNGQLHYHGQKLNAEILDRLYSADFAPYHNQKEAESMWHVSTRYSSL